MSDEYVTQCHYRFCGTVLDWETERDARNVCVQHGDALQDKVCEAHPTRHGLHVRTRKLLGSELFADLTRYTKLPNSKHVRSRILNLTR